MVAIQIPLNWLEAPGQYDWTIAVESAQYGELCAKSGSFILAGRNSTRAEEQSER